MRIQFEAGTSRHGDHGVNFLTSTHSAPVLLYAEVPVPDGASEDYGYFALKAEIIRQAVASGINPDELSFWYDDQEDRLESDASADCEVVGP